MKSRLLIVILAATATFALITLFRQMSTIRDLRADQARLRQELSSVLDAEWDKNAAGGPAQRDRLELIKLRHEKREFHERLAAARAAQPTGLKGLVETILPPSTAPMQFRSEWKGLENVATNSYASAMAMVNNGTNQQLRFMFLARAAKMNFAIGRTRDAREFAEEALALCEKYNRGGWKWNGDTTHDAHLVLGRIAAEEGRLEEAKRHLLAAGHATGSPTLNNLGPNMTLAKDLLERGEPATVLEYFELCRIFWTNREKLDEWKKEVEAGRIPEFGPNLIY